MAASAKTAGKQPTLQQVMKSLEAKGSEQVRKTFARHGAAGGKLFGVKVGDMKPIAKTIKGQQELGLALYDTGNYDAMYLAGMVVDGAQMTKTQLNAWARQAEWQMIAEYTVPWVAAESPHGRALALKWMDARKEHVAAAGWNAYAGLVTTIADSELDLAEIKSLLERVEQQIDAAPNRVRYCMNGFVIAVGAYVTPLNKRAKAAARKLGKVAVEMGGTACKVPVALDYIAKIEDSGRGGKKRKTIRC
jgi:3-methyladenine DNA glycosylase AlkD